MCKLTHTHTAIWIKFNSKILMYVKYPIHFPAKLKNSALTKSRTSFFLTNKRGVEDTTQIINYTARCDVLSSTCGESKHFHSIHALVVHELGEHRTA